MVSLLLALVPLVFLPQPASAALFGYQLHSPDPDPAVQTQIEKFLSEAEARLPPQLKQGVGRSISVRFYPLDQTTQIQFPCPAGESVKASIPGARQIYGATHQKGGIDLHQVFLAVIEKGRAGAQTYACGHRNGYDLALATLIHETAHLYDAVRKVSQKRSYRALFGWKNSFPGPYAKNQLTVRSPDPYEFHNVSESFAVNLEYFLLDPEYACRRPAGHRYFVQHFRFDPFPDRQCAVNPNIVLSGSRFIGTIDPARVYQVHYLFASKGQEMMSRWGHAMFRLVVCAPERVVMDERCLGDTEHHVVLSFRANVNDLVIDMAQGILGGYPSQLFIHSLNEIVDEYTRKQMREVMSLPLNLTEEQKALFIHRSTEMYWGYSGEYYFFSNNCAIEAADLLRAVLLQKHPLQSKGILTPLGLYRELLRDGLGDPSVLKDREEARRRGYYFPSNRESLSHGFELLRSKGMREYSTLEDFLDETDATLRRSIYGRLQVPAPGKDRKLAAAFYLLETQIRRSLTKWLDDRIVAIALGAESSAEMIELLNRYRSPRFQMNPWFLLNSGAGYGVPLGSEVVPVSEIVERQQEFFQLIKEVQARVGDRLKEDTAELDRVRDNLVFFSKEIRF